MSGLTKKQKRFCEEYLVDLNATQAYIRAGYSAKSNNIARVESSKLLTKPNIQQKIAELQKEQSERTKISADNVINELQKIAFAETEISGKEKMKALELLGKHLGMFEKSNIEINIEEKPDPLSESLIQLAEELQNDK